MASHDVAKSVDFLLSPQSKSALVALYQNDLVVAQVVPD